MVLKEHAEVTKDWYEINEMTQRVPRKKVNITKPKKVQAIIVKKMTAPAIKIIAKPKAK
jgi:hypothetical protein